MINNNLSYEDYLMACLGNIEERWKIISLFKNEIENEGDNNSDLKLTMALDMESSFDEIDEQYQCFIENLMN